MSYLDQLDQCPRRRLPEGAKSEIASLYDQWGEWHEKKLKARGTDSELYYDQLCLRMRAQIKYLLRGLSIAMGIGHPVLRGGYIYDVSDTGAIVTPIHPQTSTDDFPETVEEKVREAKRETLGVVNEEVAA